MKEVEEKVFNLVKQFTNDKGHWTSDPRLAILEKEHRITKAPNTKEPTAYYQRCNITYC